MHIEKSHLKGLRVLRYPTLLVQGSLSRGAKCKTPEAKRLKFFDQAEVVHGSASRANSSSKGAGKRESKKAVHKKIIRNMRNAGSTGNLWKVKP